MRAFHCLVFLLLHRLALALLEESIVAFEHISGAIELGRAPIIRDASDPVGVKIAADSLAKDLEDVTGVKRQVIVWNRQTDLAEKHPRSEFVIIAATVDSPLVAELEGHGKIEVEDIRGKWETFRTALVHNPLPGIENALVIVGSDKRGTLFGVFTLSEQAGQSPLHYWADVPATKHDRIFVLNKTTTHGEPSVKYRGIFINDEAPALTSWWAKHSNREDYTFDAEFYTHVFDLLVRLKANFLWPAMWGSFVPRPGRIFFTDDPRNQQLADDYGIVVSTSHHEPMQRASNEWKKDKARLGKWNWEENRENVVDFMEEGVRRAGDNETYFTLGMRGENDGPIEADDPIEVLRDVFSTQRELLDKYHPNETALQAWAVYKEVMTYYADGLVPPEDVTLIFTDDNWGNVQRLPTKEETERSGGIGLYYHFDYVGRPKSWKWQNNNNLPKAYKELYQTYERGADRIWVLNVGDIKPVEIPLSFSLDLAWNVSRFDFDTIPTYLQALAARDFGSEYAEEIASALLEYSHLVGLRKFELLEPTTYSILNFREAETILEQWKRLSDKAEDIHQSLPKNRRDALYHLLTYPATAGYNYYKTILGQGQNRQFAFERRNSANEVAQQVLEYFEDDYDLNLAYDKIADGKWAGFSSTPKFDMGTADWRPSSRDVVANLSYVQLRQDFDYGFGNLGIYVEQSLSAYRQARICASINPSLPTEEGFSAIVPVLDPYGAKSRLIELFHRGDHRKNVEWSLEIPHPWLQISKTSGTLSKDHPDERLEVSVDWSAVPTDFYNVVEVRIEWEAPYFDIIYIPVRNIRVPEDFKGFPESNGFVSIEAPHFQRSSGGDVGFKHIEYLGSRSRSGSIALRPYSAARESEDTAKDAWVEYDFYLYNSTEAFNVTVYINGALDTDPGLPMQFSFTVDEHESANFTRVLGEPAKAGDTPPGWSEAVGDHVWKKIIEIDGREQGVHTIRWRANSPEVYLEKIVLALDGHLDSYLGPPEVGVGL